MKNFLRKKVYVTSYNVDFNKNLTLPACMGIFQDIADDHGKMIGADRATLLKTSNAFWVITKVKLQINDFPKLNDKLDIETWTIDNTPVKFERDCCIAINKKTLISLKSEWVALDANTRHIRAAKTLKFPFKMKNRSARAVSQEYTLFKESVSQKDFCYMRTIYSTDIDVNMHVNNCYYSRFVLDCFTTEFLKKNKLTEYEIHFLNECKEGEQLNFYKKQLDTNAYYVEARVEDRVIIKVILKF